MTLVNRKSSMGNSDEIEVPKEIQDLAIKSEVAPVISLVNRHGVIETNLILTNREYNVEFSRFMFNYKIEAQYPFTLHGKEPNCNIIDFSDGPLISLGDTICNMRVQKITSSEITFTKIHTHYDN